MARVDEIKKKYSSPKKQKKPFASTGFGVAVNTVTGLPKAARKVGKEILQGIARSGGQIGLTVMGTKELPETKVSKAIFGEKPLTDIPTAIKKTREDLKKYKLSDNAAKVTAPVLVVGSIIGDVLPTGAGKRAIQEAGEEAIKFFAKTTDVSEIKKVLQVFEHPEDTIDDVANALSKAKTKEEVVSVIKNSTPSEPRPTQARPQEVLQPEQNPRPQTTEKVPTSSLSPEVSSYEIKIQQENDAVNKLLDALKQAKPLRGEQEKLYTQARKEKMIQVQEARDTTSGESGFYSELGKLRGELPKVQFEELRKSISQEEVDTLFNMAKESPRLDFFEKINARSGLVKMLRGEVPTQSEIKLLNQVYPRELIKELLSKRPFMERFNDAVLKTLNLPRALRSSFDLSAPLRQGIFLVGKKRFYESFGSMFKQAFNEKQFLKMQDEIYTRATYPEMKRAGLAITELDDLVSTREEAFASNWAEKIPVFGRFVRGSSRAYTGFLNKLRADVFDDMLKKAAASGRDIEDEKFLKGLAGFINAATGRGNLGSLERASGALNGIMFSPRLMASRVQLLNPAYYVKADPFVRKEALKSLISFAAMGMTVLTLAKLGGAEVGDDPTSSDFGKIKVGDTRYDIFGGFQQYVVAASRLLSEKTTSTTTGKTRALGNGYNSTSRLDIATKFFRGKLNPLAAFITDMLDGENLIGEKFELDTETKELFMPLIIENLKELAKEDPELLPTGILAIFGVGVQSYSSGVSARLKELKKKYSGTSNSKGRLQEIREKYSK